MSKKRKVYQPNEKREFASNKNFQTPESRPREEAVVEEKDDSGLNEEIEKAVQGLWYISETDAEIELFTGKKTNSVAKEVLIEQAEIPVGTDIEEHSFADFFKNPIEIQDWFGEEEKETAAKFSRLKKLLEENLKDLKVFKVGQTEIDVYVVGLDKNSVLRGIKTKAVET